MSIRRSARTLVWGGLLGLGLCLGIASNAALGADKPAAEAEAKKPSGRLPAHYGDVVTPEQKQKIYAIQTEYQPKIAALKEQLKTLDKELDGKIEAVLSPEQKQKLAAVKAAAAAKRKAAKPAVPAAKPGEKAKAGDKAKAEVPAEAGKAAKKKT